MQAKGKRENRDLCRCGSAELEGSRIETFPSSWRHRASPLFGWSCGSGAIGLCTQANGRGWKTDLVSSKLLPNTLAPGVETYTVEAPAHRAPFSFTPVGLYAGQSIAVAEKGNGGIAESRARQACLLSRGWAVSQPCVPSAAWGVQHWSQSLTQPCGPAVALKD
ncbi:hypothetical protein VTK26DRAFT_3356 [Humicola hyalothermophila]